MIELQEDEVDNHDTSTIDEVSFAANLSVASCLKMPKTQQPTKKTNCKNMTNQPNKNMQNNMANQPTKQTKKLKIMANQTKKTICKKI